MAGDNPLAAPQVFLARKTTWTLSPDCPGDAVPLSPNSQGPFDHYAAGESARPREAPAEIYKDHEGKGGQLVVPAAFASQSYLSVMIGMPGDAQGSGGPG